jgi:UDP-3-O-[3-hydroxymyristoyl] glucosamine N-acyltransferase
MIKLLKPVSASELAALCGGKLHGPDATVDTITPLEESTSTSLAFLQEGRLSATPGILLAQKALAPTTIQVDDPLLVLSQLLNRWFPEPLWQGAPTAEGAWVAINTCLEKGVRLHPGVVIGPGCQIGEGSVLFPNVVFQPGVRIGKHCRIHAGSVLGADGFRYHPTTTGLAKVPQVGGVVLGDEVELGANCTIDRGFLSDTILGNGCKLDNLVHIGHNCRLGAYVIIAAQSGLSGSCRVGDGVLIGGQVGLADKTIIGSKARIGAQSGLHGEIPAGETWLGTPALPISIMRRVYALTRELPDMWKSWKKSQ